MADFTDGWEVIDRLIEADPDHASDLAESYEKEESDPDFEGRSEDLDLGDGEAGSGEADLAHEVGDVIKYKTKRGSGYGVIQEIDTASNRATIIAYILRKDGRIAPTTEKKNVQLEDIQGAANKKVVGDLTPPAEAAENAVRGMWYYRNWSSGVPRHSIDLANGDDLAEENFDQFLEYFAENFDMSGDPEDPEYAYYLLHGGDEMRDWTFDMASDSIKEFTDDGLREIVHSTLSSIRDKRYMYHEPGMRDRERFTDRGVVAFARDLLGEVLDREMDLSEEDDDLANEFVFNLASPDDTLQKGTKVSWKDADGSKYSGTVKSVTTRDGKPNTVTVTLSDGTEKTVPISVVKGNTKQEDLTELDFAAAKEKGLWGTKSWSEALHPRHPAGSGKGGKFAPKGEGGGEGKGAGKGTGKGKGVAKDAKGVEGETARGTKHNLEFSEDDIKGALSSAGLEDTPENRTKVMGALAQLISGGKEGDRIIGGGIDNFPLEQRGEAADAVAKLFEKAGGKIERVAMEDGSSYPKITKMPPEKKPETEKPAETSEKAFQLPIDLAEPQQVGPQVWRKHVLPYGKIHYRDQVLDFSKDFARKLVENFKQQPFHQVPFVMVDGKNQHNSDPERVRGEVKGLELGDDGVYATVETNEEGSEYLKKKNPNLGTSVRVLFDYTRPADKRKFGPVLEHLAGTTKPHVPGLKPWEPAVSLSEGDTSGGVEVEDLTSCEFVKEGGDTKTTPQDLSNDNHNHRKGGDMEENVINGVDLSTLDDTAREAFLALHHTATGAVELAEKINRERHEERVDAMLKELRMAGVPNRACELAEPYLKVFDGGTEEVVVEMSEDGEVKKNWRDLALSLLGEMKGTISFTEESVGDLSEDGDEEALLAAYKAQVGR